MTRANVSAAVSADVDEIGAALLEYVRTRTVAHAATFAEAPQPLSGGYDTHIYAFSLQDAPAEWSAPLVLRVLRPGGDGARALREEAVQNTVRGQGYPSPRALAARADDATLGAPFLIMERLAGSPLPEAQRIGIGSALARLHVQLHSLDPAPLAAALRALDPAGTGGGDVHALLAQLGQRISALPSNNELASGAAWLREHQPPASAPAVICHGDFHPFNVMRSASGGLGVIDWPNALIAAREFDVANTLVTIRYSSIEGASFMERLGLLAAPILARAYLRAYGRSLIDESALPYYEAVACVRALVRAAEQSNASPPLAADPLTSPRAVKRLSAHFAEITGLAV